MQVRRSLTRSVVLLLVIASIAVAQEDEGPGVAEVRAARAAIEGGKFEEAVALLEKALAAQKKAYGEPHHTVLDTEHLLGYSYTGLGRFERALDYFERVRSMAQSLEGRGSFRAVRELWFIADCQIRLGRNAKAETSARQAHFGMKAAWGKDYRGNHVVLGILAAARRNQGRFAAAGPVWEQVLRIRRRKLGPAHPATLSALQELGRSEYELGDYQSAVNHTGQLLALIEKLDPPNPGWVASTLALRGICLGHLGRHEEALPDYRRVREIRWEHDGPTHADTATAENNLAALLRDLERYDEAEEHYRNSMAIYSIQPEVSEADLAWPTNGLAQVRRAQGRLVEAEELCRKALLVREQLPESARTVLAGNLVTLGEILADRGRTEEAGAAADRAFEILVKAVDSCNIRFREAVELRRRLLRAAKRTEDLAEFDRRVAAKRTAEWTAARTAAGLAELRTSHAEAEYRWTRALRVAEGDAARTRIALAGRGRVRLVTRSLDSALEDLAAAAASWRDAPASEEFPRRQNLVRLAQTLGQARRYGEAVDAWKEVLPLLRKADGADSKAVADARFLLALALIEVGKHAEAIPHLEQILPWFEKRMGEDSTEVIGVLQFLVGALQAGERWGDSLEPARRWARLAEARYTSESSITKDAKAALRKATEKTETPDPEPE